MESSEQSHHSGMGNPFRNSTSDGDDVYQGEDENDETDNQSEIGVSSKTKLGMDTNTFNLSLKCFFKNVYFFWYKIYFI